ncbi:hypothetical protein BT69DRAFT_1285353 [Atractiella rhizophila]|nr:hypothetical protein BT69DRAFT_1285353 [Atractiella rhizophila]
MLSNQKHETLVEILQFTFQRLIRPMLFLIRAAWKRPEWSKEEMFVVEIDRSHVSQTLTNLFDAAPQSGGSSGFAN